MHVFRLFRIQKKCMFRNFPNCLEGNTMSNRGAYSTKERMPSDRNYHYPQSAWKAVPDLLSYITFRDVLPSRQYKDYGLQSPHILVSLVCTGLLIVLPSRQFATPETYLALIFPFIPCFPCSKLISASLRLCV